MYTKGLEIIHQLWSRFLKCCYYGSHSLQGKGHTFTLASKFQVIRIERALSIFLSQLMWMVGHLIKFAVHKVISELFEKCYAQLSLIITQWKLASKLLSLMMIHGLTSAVPLWSSGASSSDSPSFLPEFKGNWKVFLTSPIR